MRNPGRIPPSFVSHNLYICPPKGGGDGVFPCVISDDISPKYSEGLKGGANYSGICEPNPAPRFRPCPPRFSFGRRISVAALWAACTCAPDPLIRPSSEWVGLPSRVRPARVGARRQPWLRLMTKIDTPFCRKKGQPEEKGAFKAGYCFCGALVAVVAAFV